ncbi:MAG: GNAT family N-acetyltransferase [Gammaproteobacteria bacterium]
MKFRIRSMLPADWPQVERIYGEGIAGGLATFEMETPAWEQWHEVHLESCRLVAEGTDRILGWAALAPVSRRHVYRGVAEVSVYVDPEAGGRGIGKALLQKLIDESERACIWTLKSSIFPENTTSIVLHEKCGFRRIGYSEKVGFRDGVWKDNIYFERRSRTVGV